MRQRGSFDRRTGKTTRRNKVKTHWGRKASRGRPVSSGKPGKAGSTSARKA